MTIALLILMGGRATAAAEPPHPDSLYVHHPAITSDRAAGIGKRVQPGGSLVFADIKGPAIIRHIWMTNIRGVEPVIAAGKVSIRFYWDGHETPDLEVPLNEFFGARFTASKERSFRMDLGKNAYYAMPFGRSARVEITNHSETELVGVYWQIDYDKLERTPGEREYFQPDSRVASPVLLTAMAGETRQIEAGGELRPGQRLTIATLKGPAVIRRLTLAYETTAGADQVVINRGVLVRMFWDDEAQPSVEVPLADFFGTGFGERREFDSATWRQHGKTAEILFPMPFKQAARIELVNVATRDAGRFTWRIEYESKPRAFLDADVEYFHACFRMSRPVPLNSTHVALETGGPGKFVGLVWNCHWLNAEQKPEGTQNFWVDGVRIQSTGSEDYFGRAWGFGKEPLIHAYKGITIAAEKSTGSATPVEWRRVTAYRAHVLDPIIFQKSLKLDFTCYGYNRGHRTDEYTTACFWYQREPHKPFMPLPPIEDLLPLDHPDSFGFGMAQVHQHERKPDRVAAMRVIAGLMKAHPANPKLADLSFKMGCLLEEEGRLVEASKMFRAVREVHRGSEVGRDAADKVWLLEQPGRMLLTFASASRADVYVDGRKVEVPATALEGVPDWGQPEIYRFTYPAMKVSWQEPSSAVMRLPTIRLTPGVGGHVLAVRASAARAEPIFTPRVGYLFGAIDVAGPDIVTDASWKMSEAAGEGWQNPGFDDANWSAATAHPLSAFGDGSWTWLWPRGFRIFPGRMERIWNASIFPEEKGYKETLYFRRDFRIPGKPSRP